MASIHTFLKEIRIEKGLTQEEVADRIGLTRQAISGYESGKRQPGIDILMKLAEIYDVSMETILYGKKDAAEKRQVKRIAVIVAAIFLVLQMLTGVLSTLSFVLYPLEEGIVPPEQIEVMEKHFELSLMAGRTERAASIALILGSIVVMGIDLSNKVSFLWKRKLGFFLAVLGISWAIAIFWGIVHPMYGIMDFVVRGPVYFAGVAGLLLIDLKNKGYINCEQCRRVIFNA